MARALDAIDPKVLQRHLSRYFIGILVVTDYVNKARQDEEAGIVGSDGHRRMLLSSFPVVANDRWALATAGHVIGDLLAIQNNGHHVTAKVFDRHGIRKSDPFLPLIINTTTSIHFDQKDGKDFGFIELPNNTRDNLIANGFAALTASKIPEPLDSFNDFVVLGFPSVYEVPDSNQPGVVSESFTLVRFGNRTARPTKWEDKLTAPLLYFCYPPRFASDPPEMSVVDDPDGLSGGPVFGFRAVDDSVLEYRLVGMMVRYDEGTAMVTPFHSILHRLHLKAEVP